MLPQIALVESRLPHRDDEGPSVGSPEIVHSPSGDLPIAASLQSTPACSNSRTGGGNSLEAPSMHQQLLKASRRRRFRGSAR
ncbi:MAG TPA: hypothetical protein DEB17_03835 [Chlorobaculum sp.]|uniref:Uncharacterized protein n=1 Tax=Chlorobaculum tepidum (strain ATCC 49652 / DSM 12025 / NBRC 103806 / TLS) TaxID=194439 RepID=Q8KDX3_CHLTE|nr:hypothetical protein CT0921 [Chlorobaculum tepidum TLS]HBU23116.1 hypothetical protein [Chlorobaculum sp.]